jgi:hypothetical protein
VSSIKLKAIVIIVLLAAPLSITLIQVASAQDTEEDPSLRLIAGGSNYYGGSGWYAGYVVTPSSSTDNVYTLSIYAVGPEKLFPVTDLKFYLFIDTLAHGSIQTLIIDGTTVADSNFQKGLDVHPYKQMANQEGYFGGAIVTTQTTTLNAPPGQSNNGYTFIKNIEMTLIWKPSADQNAKLMVLVAGMDSQRNSKPAFTPISEGTLFQLPEYYLGGLAALGACFVGLVVFKKCRSHPQLRFK